MRRFLCMLAFLIWSGLHALDDRSAMQEVEQWTRDFILQYKEKPPKCAKVQKMKTYTPKDMQAVVRTAKIKGTLYSFVFAGAKAVSDTPSKYTAYGFCVGILAHNKLNKGFCLKREGVGAIWVRAKSGHRDHASIPLFFCEQTWLRGHFVKTLSTGLDQRIAPKRCFSLKENQQSLNRACFCAVDEMFITKRGEFLTISALVKR